MILRSIIIDDEQKGIDALRILIERFLNDLKVVATTTDPKSGISLVEDYRPEIVFLDVDMPEMNGFDLLARLKHHNFNLVFITAHQQYGLRALKNGAIDYLLKPVDHEDLRIAIERVKSKLLAHERQSLEQHLLLQAMPQGYRGRLLVHSKTGVESIDTNDIIFLESSSNYTNINLTDSKSILTAKTLKEFESQLCNEQSGFIRVHHSFIVNLKKVMRLMKFNEALVMSDGCVIPLAKSRKPAFFRHLSM